MIFAFVKMLFAWAQAQATPEQFDIIDELPSEVSSTIFRYLDGESLINAASVNHQWNSVCKSDIVVRGKIRRYLRQQRKASIQAYMKPSKTVKIVREPEVPVGIFGMRNGNVSVQKIPVKYGKPKAKTIPQISQFKVSIKPNDMKIKKKSIVNINNNCRPTRNLRL